MFPAVLVFILEFGALALLTMVTTSDPGFIPKGPNSVQLPTSSPTSNNSDRYSDYMCAMLTLYHNLA